MSDAFEKIDLSLQVKKRFKEEIDLQGVDFARWLKKQLVSIAQDHWLHWSYPIRMLFRTIYLSQRKRPSRKYKSIAKYVEMCIKEDPEGTILMRINGQPEITVFSILRKEDYSKVDVFEIEYNRKPCVFFFIPEFDTGRLYIKLYNWLED